jgi:L-ascorbate metabolism protein UlaG (beta-lactamase superfamily)
MAPYKKTMQDFEGINWFGHASFSFVDKKGKRIYYIDPFDLKVKKLKEADIIFITHAHPDHFSPSDIAKILKDNTVVVATEDVLEKINIPNNNKIIVKPNQSYTIKDFSFATVPAYNNHPDKLNFHPKSNNWVGYIFALNGKMIYHAGDTDFIQEMKRLKSLNLDIAMIPIGGTYTMDVVEAAAAANAICAKITIPMHYRNLLREKTVDAEQKFKHLVTNSKVVILEELK